MKKRMGVFFTGFVSVIGLIMFLSGCSDFALKDSLETDVNGSRNYGSVTVLQSDENRALNISSISFASVSVTGTGITTQISAEVGVTSGSGSITVNGIPAGKNRIVTVYALDSGKNVIQGVTIRNIVDVEAGKQTSLNVNWSTTALGNVFNSLNTLGYDLSSIDSSGIAAINGAIDSSKHALLINTAQIASDYKNNTLKTSSSYVLTAATASVNYTQGSGAFKVQVCDPISSVKDGTSGLSAVTNIAPGTWDIHLLDENGSILKTKTLNTFTSGGTVSADFDEAVMTDIIVHAKYMYIHYWETGAAGKSTIMTEETGGWYGYTFENTSSINMLFSSTNTAAGDWSGQTYDLSRTECGEYWYKDGSWYDCNPEDSVLPVLVSFTSSQSGTVSGDVVLTVSATDNSALSKAVISVDGTEAGTITLSGTSDTKNYTWDSSKYKNGSHEITAVVYDGAKNVSSSKSITLTTSNTNLAPVAVITGSSRAVPGCEKTYSAASSYDQTTGGSISSYKWTVSGATIKSGATSKECVVTMPAVETTVTVSLVVTDDEGTSSQTVSKTVSVSSVEFSGDFREETIYFLMTTRFYDGDSSNNQYSWDEGGEYLKITSGDCAWRGDFKGLIAKLDYIKALGFSAVWITPVVENASGIDYHGYHASDFTKVDDRYLSAGVDYQTLIDACHEKGIKVIQDIVLNHTSNFGEKGLFHMFDKNISYQDAVGTHPGTEFSVSSFVSPASDNGYGAKCLEAGAAMAGGTYSGLLPARQFAARINAMKEDSIDTSLIYHHTKTIDWNGINCQLGQMADDCVDLNTENPDVIKYLIDAYSQYIEMGVDAFRIDTVKHINRLMFNKYYNPAFMQAAKNSGNDNFYMFGEVCARYRGRWNEGVPALSPSFYTWKETESGYTGEFVSSFGTEAQNTSDTAAHFEKYKSSFTPPAPALSNTKLNGNAYHSVDYKNKADLSVIDFPMHWAFNSVSDAFSVAKDYDDDYSDASWNVTYVDSHDYAPDNAPENKRYTGNWPDKLNLMFTFRGIPCIYYGTEIEFKKGMAIDPANDRTSLENSGRAYYGSYLEGSVSASDFGTYTASGTVAETLNHSLAQHIRRLNQIRRAIPALQKGQYSTENCSGSIAFKRRYTDSDVDSFALVAINGQATFTGIPSGTYVEVITGNSVSSSGSLTTDSIGGNNMRVYVLQTGIGDIPAGKIGTDGEYLK